MTMQSSSIIIEQRNQASKSPQRSTRRHWLRIIVEILEAANNPTNKSHLVQKSRLSFAQLSNYIDYLQARGLLTTVPQHHHRQGYLTTEKGKIFTSLFSATSLFR